MADNKDLTCDKCEHTADYSGDNSKVWMCCDIMKGDGIEKNINYYIANQDWHWNCPLRKKEKVGEYKYGRE